MVPKLVIRHSKEIFFQGMSFQWTALQGILFPRNFFPRNAVPRIFFKYIVSHFNQFSTLIELDFHIIGRHKSTFQYNEAWFSFSKVPKKHFLPLEVWISFYMIWDRKETHTSYIDIWHLTMQKIQFDYVEK